MWTTFIFEGHDTAEKIDKFHVTHKYFKGNNNLVEVANYLEVYFNAYPFKQFAPVFNQVEMFGQNKDIRVVTLADGQFEQYEKNWMVDLRNTLADFYPEDYPLYRPHVTHPTLNKIHIPIIGYGLISDDNLVWSTL